MLSTIVGLILGVRAMATLPASATLISMLKPLAETAHIQNRERVSPIEAPPVIEIRIAKWESTHASMYASLLTQRATQASKASALCGGRHWTKGHLKSS
jgi:hypothetical protein